MESNIVITTMRLTKAIITSRESVKLERGLGRLLLSCKFPFLVSQCFFSVLQTGCIFSADTPPCALLLHEVCFSTDPGSVHTLKLSYSRMSLGDVCEIHRGIFNDWAHHTLLILCWAVPDCRTVGGRERLCCCSSRWAFNSSEHILLVAMQPGSPHVLWYATKK